MNALSLRIRPRASSRIAVLAFVALSVLHVSAVSADDGSVRNLEYRWMKLELEEFRRLVRWLRKDEAKVRHELASLRGQRDNLQRFFSGDSRTRTRSAARKSLNQFEQTPVVKQVLMTDVPPFGADQFVQNVRTFNILNPDGTFVTPPPALVPDSAGSRVAEAKARFEDRWYEIVAQIRVGRPLSAGNAAELNDLLCRWEAIAAPYVVEAAPQGRFQAKRYFEQVGKLLQSLQSPRNAERLVNLQSGGAAFPGGTLADLVRHIIDNQLSIRYGSQAQLTLSELGHDIARELDSLVSLAEYRVEHYKAQNPAHNAALKARIVGSYAWLGWPVGLGSKAYGPNLPQREDVVSRALPYASVDQLDEILSMIPHDAEQPVTVTDSREPEIQ